MGLFPKLNARVAPRCLSNVVIYRQLSLARMVDLHRPLLLRYLLRRLLLQEESASRVK
jgi:hypothetical protein